MLPGIGNSALLRKFLNIIYILIGVCSKISPKFALTDVEIQILDQVIKDNKSKELSNYLIKIARLGGYLNRASDSLHNSL